MTRAALAREKGVSRSAVSKACAEGGPLHDAIAGRFINASDPLVSGWLAEPVRGPAAESTPEGDGVAPSPGAPSKAEMLAVRHRKLEAEARRLELANAVTEGHLISSKMVHTHVFGLIDGTYRRLLTDFSQTVALRLRGHYASGGGLEEGKIIVRDNVSKILKSCKAQAIRKLHSTTTEHQELMRDAEHIVKTSRSRQGRKKR